MGRGAVKIGLHQPRTRNLPRRCQGRRCTGHLHRTQLSTNDATTKKELGQISKGFDQPDFDTKTITGAEEFIIWYAQETWNCPVIFYTGSY